MTTRSFEKQKHTKPRFLLSTMGICGASKSNSLTCSGGSISMGLFIEPAPWAGTKTRQMPAIFHPGRFWDVDFYVRLQTLPNVNLVGKLVNYVNSYWQLMGNSPCYWMGKSTISTGPFSSSQPVTGY